MLISAVKTLLLFIPWIYPVNLELHLYTFCKFFSKSKVSKTEKKKQTNKHKCRHQRYCFGDFDGNGFKSKGRDVQ